jgi:hypothetical protein
VIGAAARPASGRGVCVVERSVDPQLPVAQSGSK